MKLSFLHSKDALELNQSPGNTEERDDNRWALCFALKRLPCVTYQLQTGHFMQATAEFSSLIRRVNLANNLESIVQALDHAVLRDKICQLKWLPG